ncbi:MAG: hypothetical protein RIQ89_2248 [Bacteroidota bacterium]|jgi:capsular polysaccharide biosynthesis protein
MNQNFSSVSLINFITKHIKHLAIIALVSGVLAAIVSGPWIIKPKYKGTAIVYPSFLYSFSAETPTEQMLQFFKSNEIKENIIKTFNLYAHYGIDSVGATSRSIVGQVYDENVSIKQTEYESIEINVLDTDPRIAAAIADSICAFMNYKARSVQHKQSYDVFKINEQQYHSKKLELDSMEKAAAYYRSTYGFLDMREQTKEYTKAYLKAKATGKSGSEAKAMLDTMASKGQEYVALVENLYRVRGHFNDIKIKYEQSIIDTGKILTYTNFVTKPIIPDKKAYPIRWLIVLGAVAGSTLLGLIVLLVLNRSKEFKA